MKAMKRSLFMTVALAFGLQGAAYAVDLDGAMAAAGRLLSRNSPTISTIDLAQTSQQKVQPGAQVSLVTYDDEVVAASFRIFAQENRVLFTLVSVAGRSSTDKQAACAQVDKQLSNNQGLYTAVTIRPTQITAEGVGLFENNSDLLYIKSALGCF
jgi:hypothetical protein